MREDPRNGVRVLSDPRLDVPGHVRMTAGALGAWQRRVRDVADQRVPEAVLDVPLEAARVLTANEITPLQLVERLVHRLLVGDGRDDVPPEASPDDRRRKSTARRWGGSTSRRDAIAAVTVTGSPVPEAPSASAGRELLDEERVPFRDLDQPVDGLAAPRRVAGEPFGELPRLPRAQRIEDDARVRGQARAPGALVQELRAREDDDDARRLAQLRRRGTR